MSHERNSSTSISFEENNMFVDILHEAPLYGHRKPTRIIGCILYCILLAGYAVVAIAAPWIFLPIEKLVPSLLCSCNVAILVLTGIFQQYLVYEVHKVRLQGYYIFSQKLKHIIRLPFYTIAYGTASMLVVMVWHPQFSILSLEAFLRIIILFEVLCAGSFMSLYIGNVHQYNSMNSQPDVLKSLYSAIQPSSSLEELRYHDGSRLSDQQMALLQYQRENIHYLSEEVYAGPNQVSLLVVYYTASHNLHSAIPYTVLLADVCWVGYRKMILRLQECLSKYERTDDGITPQVDLAHLLAARDQELRALSAEMNQVQSELRLARSLIAERDSDVQQIQMTNNQYVVENERLRAILGEWSTRAAKLERSLETERMSNLEFQKNILKLRSQSAEPSD